MEAKELRIGNIVYFGVVKEPVTILAIKPDNPTILMAEPIPLTQGWLFRLGAELISENRYDFNGYSYGYFELTNIGLIVTFQSQKISEAIKYVHQLQNLYFCLTGEELTLKE